MSYLDPAVKSPRHLKRAPAASPEDGVALLLAFLVLIVLFAIVYQIHTVTQTDARVTRNELTRARMDLAIQSAMLQEFEDLAEDARAAQAGEGEGGGAAPGGAAPGGEGPMPGGGQEAGEPPRNPDTVDSRLDSWYTPKSTMFEDIQLRIFVRDENSKYNILNMLHEDEEIAEQCFQRVVRILDNARGETDLDLARGEAEEVANAMRDYMRDRRGTDERPRPKLLTESVEDQDKALPFSFREFRLLEPFEEHMFMDQFGEDDERIHSLEAFFTVYTSPAVGGESAGEGMPAGIWRLGREYQHGAGRGPRRPSRTTARSPYRLWDEIREYRNEEEEPLEGEEEEGLGSSVDEEPLLNEYGEEVIPKQIFDSLDELDELFEFKDLDESQKTLVRDLLVVESDVFEIIIAARISTSRDDSSREEFDSRREQEKDFRSGRYLVRIARAVVWRREVDEDIEIVPLVNWEILDNAPLQVLDYPEDD